MLLLLRSNLLHLLLLGNSCGFRLTLSDTACYTAGVNRAAINIFNDRFTCT